MPEWLRAAFVAGPDLHLATLVVRLVSGVLLGMLVAATYRFTRSSAHITPSFPATLVLLCILIAMVTQVIGDNVARAFSLVGALSIVRFRTVVRDTKDTAFVIYAVAVGMALGAGQAAVALWGMAAVSAAAWIFRDRPVDLTAVAPRVTLTVRCALATDIDARVQDILQQHAREIDLHSAATIRHGAGYELCYQMRLKPEATLPGLLGQLNLLEGIQTLEIRKDSLPEE